MNAQALNPFAIAELGQRHQAALQNLLLSLDPLSRYCRFAFTSDDAHLVRHATHALSTATWIAGAFPDRDLRGVIELYRHKDSSVVEAAIAVEAGWRRRGIGAALLRAAAAWATDADVKSIRLIFSAGNWPMRKLVSKANARLDLEFGEICADVPIGADCPNW
jgi:GNAT superfamily N-acetyltransferase